MSNNNPKIIVILGPTSSGKSEVAIKLARKFNGEIISVDSRQVYRGMDIGTGKVTGRLRTVIPSKRSAPRDLIFMSDGIPHHLIDTISPRADYNVSKFKKDAEKIIAEILARGKVPIFCGGTGFWIKAVVDDVAFPEVKPDWKLREKLNQKSALELIQELEKLDPARAQTIDAKNKVRLIRALEICKVIGKVPALNNGGSTSIREVEPPRYSFLQIGIDLEKEILYKNIQKRLHKRFAAGMIAEVEILRKKYKLSWKKIQSFGLGYYWIPLFLQKKITRAELFENVYGAEKNYAKRQMTWFRKDPRIKWLKTYPAISKAVAKFL